MSIMPNVIGLDYEAALQAMIEAGVREVPLNVFTTDPVTIIWTTTGTKPGFVTAQLPVYGTQMSINSPAFLTVTSPPMGIASGVTQV